MARERPDYRDLLERLDRAFPGRELLTRDELALFLGVSRQTVYNRYSFPPRAKISKTQAARAISTGT